MKSMEYQNAFDGMRSIGQHAKTCLDWLGEGIKPGVSTADINHWVKLYADEQGLICAPYLYKGYPAYCCTSVNHIVCHGLPSIEKVLKEGDIISVDVTFISTDGWHGDSCRTYAVGKVSVLAERLMKIAHGAMMQGIKECVAGAKMGSIGHAIEEHATFHLYSTVKQYCGHGIGQKFHEPPFVLMHHAPETVEAQIVLEPGMMFTIEPMICAGSPETKVLKDKWTVVTRDRSLCAQYEHTIGINAEGPPEIFTA